MLIRVLPAAICALVVFAGCKQSVESKLIGSWRAKMAEDAGEIRFVADYTFTSREWAVTYSHQPPILSDAGDWHISGRKLVLNFHGDTHPRDAKSVEFSLTMHDRNHFTLRQKNGVETTLERLK